MTDLRLPGPDNKKGVLKGRLFYCLLAGFCLLLLTSSVNAKGGDCEGQRTDATVRVKQVIDGDTVRLTDNRLVRFIGINSPEIDHRYGQSEPLSEQARKQLEQIIGKKGTLLLQFGKEKKDRHGRLLAHIFTPAGVNVQQQLLKKGLAFQIVIPPNLFGLECYRQGEKQARRQRLGVWSSPYFSAKTTGALGDDERGFRLVIGTVGSVDSSRNSLWLNMLDNPATSTPGQGETGKPGKVTLRISKSHLHYFKGLNVSTWQGQQLTARGWLYPKNGKLIMSVKHPAALSFAREEAGD